MFRSTSTAILSAVALAALAACGDKVELTETPAPTPHITAVTVSGPTAYQIGTLPNDSLSYAATVVADAGFTGNRAVTWTSSNAGVFRITSASGAGKALAAGSTVITATSAVDGVTGQIALTVTAAPGPVVVPPASIVISRIAQGANNCGLPTGGNVDLGNVCGQVDVSVDVSYNAANRPATINLEMIGPAPASTVTTCDSRPFGGAAASGADLDVSTVVLSCLTARFDTTTGATSFKNGTYTLRASLTGAANTSSTPAVTSLTVNNMDFIRASITGTTLDGGRTAASATVGGFQWRSGTVNTKILPVLYTAGRSVASASVSLINGGTDLGWDSADPSGAPGTIACGTAFATQTVPAAGGAFSSAVNFSGTDAISASGVESVMIDTVTVMVAAADQAGNSVTVIRNPDLSLQTIGCGAASTAVTSGSFIRLDNRDPAPSNFDPRAAGQGANNQFPLNSAWLGKSITLPTTATATNGLIVGADLGVNTNTVTYQIAPAGTARTSSAWTNISGGNLNAVLPSSDANTYNIRVITRDALGNADTARVSLNAAAPTAAPPAAAVDPTCAVPPAGVNDCQPATFGVDLKDPTVTITTTSPASSIVSSISCTLNRPTNSSGSAAALCVKEVLTANPMTFESVDSTVTAGFGGNPAIGSGFSATPMRIAIRAIHGHDVSLTAAKVMCEVPLSLATAYSQTLAGTGGFDANCTTPTPNREDITLPVSVAVGGLPTAQDAERRVIYWTVDQANNRSTTASFQYYVDNNAPAVAPSPVAIPVTIGAGTSFTTSGQAVMDSLDIAGANGYINYPGAAIRLFMPGTVSATGAAFDSAVVRRADATVTLPTGFIRNLTSITAGAFGGGGKPDVLGIRALDAARNLSLPFAQVLPASNISGAGGAGQGYTLGTDLTDFSVSAPNLAAAVGGNQNIKNTTAGGGVTSITVATLLGRITAPSTATSSPFTQVCFYYAHTAGGPLGAEGAGTNGVDFSATQDNILIGCTSTPVVTVGPAPALSRFFDYSISWDPNALFGAGGVFNVRAIGTNANGDALVTTLVNTITLTA